MDYNASPIDLSCFAIEQLIPFMIVCVRECVCVHFARVQFNSIPDLSIFTAGEAGM